MSHRPIHRLAAVVLTTAAVASCSKPSDTTVTGAGASSSSKTAAPTYTMSASTELGPICEHQDMPYSNYICPDTGLTQLFLTSDVRSAKLVVTRNDGRTITLAMPPRVDAIFLSKSALETFLLRHYDATDPAKAASLRAFIAANYH